MMMPVSGVIKNTPLVASEPSLIGSPAAMLHCSVRTSDNAVNPILAESDAQRSYIPSRRAIGYVIDLASHISENRHVASVDRVTRREIRVTRQNWKILVCIRARDRNTGNDIDRTGCNGVCQFVNTVRGVVIQG